MLLTHADGWKEPRWEGTPVLAHEGELRTEVPFEVTVPATPPSHAGQLIQLQWVVEAKAEVVDDQHQPVTLAASAPFTLSSSEPEPGLVLSLLDEGDPSKVDRRTWAPVVGLSIILLMVLAGAFKTASDGVYGIAFGMMLPVAIVGGLLYLAVRHVQRQGKVGTPQAKVEPRTAEGYREAAGEDDYGVTVWLKPGAEVARVEAVVVVREHIEKGSGEQRVRKHHDGTRMSQNLTLGEPGVYRGPLPVPRPGTVPFDAGTRFVGIHWFLIVGVHMPDGDEHWSEPLKLSTEPRRGPGSKADRNARFAPPS